MKTLFETRIEQKSLGLPPALLRDLKKTALQLPILDEAGVEWSRKNYRKGYTSYSSISNLHEQFTVFDRLKIKLDGAVMKYARDLDLTFPRGRLEISSFWVNVMPADCYHAFHLHPNSIVSGTFYLSVPKGASPLRVEDPRAGLFMASPPRTIQIDLRPKAGEVILFESWLKHEVPPHSSKEDRVSVSFNYDWT